MLYIHRSFLPVWLHEKEGERLYKRRAKSGSLEGGDFSGNECHQGQGYQTRDDVTQGALGQWGPGYRLCWKKAPGSPDIAFPSRRLAIFVHGCYWHRCPYCQPDVPKQHSLFWAQKFAANQERDLRKNKQLGDQGWRVVTIWECQVKQGLTQQIELIINVLRYG